MGPRRAVTSCMLLCFAIVAFQATYSVAQDSSTQCDTLHSDNRTTPGTDQSANPYEITVRTEAQDGGLETATTFRVGQSIIVSIELKLLNFSMSFSDVIIQARESGSTAPIGSFNVTGSRFVHLDCLNNPEGTVRLTQDGRTSFKSTIHWRTMSPLPSIHFIANVLSNSGVLWALESNRIDLDTSLSPVVCPTDITVPAGPSSNGSNIFWETPTCPSPNDTSELAECDHVNGSSVEILEHAEVSCECATAEGVSRKCSFYISVIDITPPVIRNCPEDIQVNAPDDTSFVEVTWPYIIADDNSGATPTSNNTFPDGSFFTIGNESATSWFWDASGNVAICSFVVTVFDITPPVIVNCPSDIDVNAPADSNTAEVSWPRVTAIDNSGAIPTTNSTSLSGSSFSIGEELVTIAFWDASENVASCTFTVNVSDISPPVIVNCPRDTHVNAPSDNNTAMVTWSDVIAEDNSGTTPTTTSNVVSGSLFDIGETTVTISSWDASGNTATCTFTIEVVDITPPVIMNCPEDINVNATADNNTILVTWPEIITEDNGGRPPSVSSTLVSGSYFTIGGETVTITSEDVSGNTETCMFMVTVYDVTPPVITNCPEDIHVNASAKSSGVEVTWPGIKAEDNSGMTPITNSTSSPGFFSIGNETVKVTAFDASGNVGTCMFKLEVKDAEPPVIKNCPEDIHQYAPEDSSSVRVTWPDILADDNSGVAPYTNSTSPSGSLFAIGEETVVITSWDASGNQRICSFDVEIIDIHPPVIRDCPTDINVVAPDDSDTLAVTWDDVSADDNSGQVPHLTRSSNSGDWFVIGRETVTTTFTDDSGNSASCVFDVAVADVTPPVIANCPMNIHVNVSDDKDNVGVIWPDIQVKDNSRTALQVSSSSSSGTVFTIGEETVTITASDRSGNVGRCAFKVVVHDAEPPVIKNCPEDIHRYAPEVSSSVRVTWPDILADDNSGVAPYTNSTSPSGSLFAIGEERVVITSWDASGNQRICSFDVEIIDIHPPVIRDCPTDITVVAPDDSDTLAVTWDDISADDNSDQVPQQTSSSNSGDWFVIGRETVTNTFTDDSGNSASCVFNVTVIDVTKPTVLECPSDRIVTTCGSDARVSWTIPTSLDNSEGTPTVASLAIPGSYFTLGNHTVLYQFIDGSGNEASCMFTVQVDRDHDCQSIPLAVIVACAVTLLIVGIIIIVCVMCIWRKRTSDKAWRERQLPWVSRGINVPHPSENAPPQNVAIPLVDTSYKRIDDWGAGFVNLAYAESEAYQETGFQDAKHTSLPHETEDEHGYASIGEYQEKCQALPEQATGNAKNTNRAAESRIVVGNENSQKGNEYFIYHV